MLTIVLYHLLQYLPLPPLLAKANSLLGSGIYIFFFSSSYGLFFSKKNTWKNFYSKRFEKMLLPYYIGITLIVILNHFAGVYPESWGAYFSHLFLYKMFHEPYISSYGPQFWFISTIVQFYLVWPLFLLLAKHLKTTQLLLFSFGVSLLYSILVFRLGLQHERIWVSSVIQYFWVFALGLSTAKEQWLPRLLQLGPIRHSVLLIIGTAAVVIISELLGDKGRIFNDYFMFIAYFSACVLLYLLAQYLHFITRFVLWIESFSYSLYIIHLFIFACYMKMLSEARIGLHEVPIILALCIGAALIFDKVVNQLTNLTFGSGQPATGR